MSIDTCRAFLTTLSQLRTGLGALDAVLETLQQSVAALTSLARSLPRTWPQRRNRLRPAAVGYRTLWLTLDLDLLDRQGRRAVLHRSQRVQVDQPDATVVRELVWGEGEQLVRYRARGARRAATRAEGSHAAVLLLPRDQPAAGDRLTITSRRTIRNGFLGRQEYCEAYLERPTGRLEIRVRFPAGRSPRDARLVLGAGETVLRRLHPRYGADGHAVLRCSVRRPQVGAIYSLRWTW